MTVRGASGATRPYANAGRGGASSWAGPPRLWARTSNKKRRRLTPAYIQRARPGRAAPRAHPPAAAHDFQRDRHARRGEGRPRRAHGLAAAPAVAHAQPRDQVHQGKAVRGRLLEASSGMASEAGARGSPVIPAPRRGELRCGLPKSRRGFGERNRSRPEGSAGVAVCGRTVVTTPSGAGWGRGFPQSRLGSGSGVPWVSVGRAGVRLWGSLDIPRAELGLVLRSLGSQSRLEPGSAIPPSFRRADGVPVWGSPRSPQQARVWLGRWFRWVFSAHTGVRLRADWGSPPGWRCSLVSPRRPPGPGCAAARDQLPSEPSR